MSVTVAECQTAYRMFWSDEKRPRIAAALQESSCPLTGPAMSCCGLWNLVCSSWVQAICTPRFLVISLFMFTQRSYVLKKSSFLRSMFNARQEGRPQLSLLLTELGLKRPSLQPLVPVPCRRGWLLHRTHCSSHHHAVQLAACTKALPAASFVRWLLVALVAEGRRLCGGSFGLIWQWQRTHGMFHSYHGTHMRASAKCSALLGAGMGRDQHLLSTLKLWCCVHLFYYCCRGRWLYLSFNYFDAVWVLFWLECIKAQTARAPLLL